MRIKCHVHVIIEVWRINRQQTVISLSVIGLTDIYVSEIRIQENLEYFQEVSSIQSFPPPDSKLTWGTKMRMIQVISVSPSTVLLTDSGWWHTAHDSPCNIIWRTAARLRLTLLTIRVRNVLFLGFQKLSGKNTVINNLYEKRLDILHPNLTSFLRMEKSQTPPCLHLKLAQHW